MTSPLAGLLGAPRLAPYLSAAQGVLSDALDLYRWSAEVAGAFHYQIGYVEVAVRNALDAQLRAWNQLQGFGPDWTSAKAAAVPLYGILTKGELDSARRRAKEHALARGRHHPRHLAPITHDDVIVQLTFGSWAKLIKPKGSNDPDADHQRLWAQSLRNAFPNSTQDEAARKDIGQKLATLLGLRNRVAHHENLLDVNIRHRLNDLLSVLGHIDPAYPRLLVKDNPLRRLAKADPRLSQPAVN